MLAYLIKMEAIRKPQMAKLKAGVIAAIEDDEHESGWRSLRWRTAFVELHDMATIPEDAAAKLIAILPKRAKEEPVDVDQLDAGQGSEPIGCAFLARSHPRAKGTSGLLLTHVARYFVLPARHPKARDRTTDCQRAEVVEDL